MFQPTLLLWGATGRDLGDVGGIFQFQPTPPLRGATRHTLNFSTSSSSFQPTLPLRGATLVHSVVVVVRHVSTHAPLAGSDCSGFCCSCASMSFNPRSPCGERRHGDGTGNRQQGFQPTLPLRGATLRLAREVEPCDVSTHAPLAGSDYQGKNPTDADVSVSTHAPLAGSDHLRQPHHSARFCRFNPRSPCGERRFSMPSK